MTERSAASGESQTAAAAPARPSSGETRETPESVGSPQSVGPQQLGTDLLQWFAVHRRDLPWRVGRNPYRIWISEVMLQQTRVDTVVPYYRRFLEAFPTVPSLAAAPEADVLKLWEGLGYYSRARNLHRAAQQIVERFAGELPRTVDELRTLPGIGRYTAGAIASIAFNEPVAAVDGNVLRVIARLAGITDVITKAAVQRRIEEHVVAMIPPGQAALMTEALMELGALVCVPRTPLCEQCPWQDDCVAVAKGIAAELPNRPARTRPRIVMGAVAVVRSGDTVLVTQRPEEGLLAGMWEFPWVETPVDERRRGRPDGRQGKNDAVFPAPEDKAEAVADAEAEADAELLRDALRERHGIDVRVVAQLPPVRHVFSHLQWQLSVFECELVDEADNAATLALPVDVPGAVARQHATVWGRDGGRTAESGATWASDTKSDPDVDSNSDSALKTKWVTGARLRQLPFGRAHRRIATAWLKDTEAGIGRATG